MKVDQHRPLTVFDTEFQTLGCRIAAPENCRNNRTERKCAFVREDNICHLVPRSWKKRYEELRRKDAALVKTDDV